MTVRYKQTTTTVQVDTVRVHDEQNIVCNCVYLKESSQTCDLQHSRPTLHRLLHTKLQHLPILLHLPICRYIQQMYK